MDLLVTARTSKAPGEYYRELNAVFGPPYYTRSRCVGDDRI